MPTLSMFFGIVVRVNPREHNPPHFHAQFQDDELLANWNLIQNGETYFKINPLQ